MLKQRLLPLCSILFLLFIIPSMAAVKSVINDGALHIYLCGTGTPNLIEQQTRKPACLAVIGDNQFMLFDDGEGATQTPWYMTKIKVGPPI